MPLLWLFLLQQRPPVSHLIKEHVNVAELRLIQFRERFHL